MGRGVSREVYDHVICECLWIVGDRQLSSVNVQKNEKSKSEGGIVRKP